MIETVLNLPILFFVFGIISVFLNSNLEIPQSMINGIVLYLMLAIGLKGGISLAEQPITWSVIEPSLIVILGSVFVATYVFWICKKITNTQTAAGIAATYGSNSTMTFITAASFLTIIDVAYGGYMTVALVLMETPAIIYGIYLANKEKIGNIKQSIIQALTDGTQLLLIASLIIGFITVSLTSNTDILYGFINGDIFTGALCFFLLSMGLKVGNSLKTNLIENLNIKLISVAIIIPWVNGFIGYGAGVLFGLNTGDLYLTTLLMASASYIVAPAVLSKAVPDAEIGKYLTMSLAITFPMNILIGLPVWWNMIG
jgi:hypothetical protein